MGHTSGLVVRCQPIYLDDSTEATGFDSSQSGMGDWTLKAERTTVLSVGAVVETALGQTTVEGRERSILKKSSVGFGVAFWSRPCQMSWKDL